MASWQEIETEVPELAREVRERFAVRRHATLATLRKDGSPRISGTEVEFSDGEVRLGSMPGAVKALDLRRDARMALHSPTTEPPADDPTGWAGEAKLAGLAVEVSDPERTDEPHAFRIDVRELVLTRVEGDELVVTSWHQGRGVQTRRRR